LDFIRGDDAAWIKEHNGQSGLTPNRTRCGGATNSLRPWSCDGHPAWAFLSANWGHLGRNQDASLFVSAATSGTGSIRQFVSKATRSTLPSGLLSRVHIRQGDFASGLAFGFQKFDDLSDLAP